MIGLRRMSVFDVDFEIWGLSPARPNPARARYLVEVALKQIVEILEADRTGETETERNAGDAKEWADVALVAIHALALLGYDPESKLVDRLETRHRGKVAAIMAKYGDKA